MSFVHAFLQLSSPLALTRVAPLLITVCVYRRHVGVQTSTKSKHKTSNYTKKANHWNRHQPDLHAQGSGPDRRPGWAGQNPFCVLSSRNFLLHFYLKPILCSCYSGKESTELYSLNSAQRRRGGQISCCAISFSQNPAQINVKKLTLIV